MKSKNIPAIGVRQWRTRWRAYRNPVYFHEGDKCGHFAAWEEPQLFSEEIRSAFRSLR